MSVRNDTRAMRAHGYRCQRETISGQGYMGGDGIACYRVRDARGDLAIARVSTHRTARAAWREAFRRWHPLVVVD